MGRGSSLSKCRRAGIRKRKDTLYIENDPTTLWMTLIRVEYHAFENMQADAASQNKHYIL